MIARWWGGGRITGVSRALARMADPPAEVDVDGVRGLVLADDVEVLAAGSAEHATRLLPGFDPFTNELPRRVDSVLAGAHHDRVHRTAGWVSPIVVGDGRVAGTWEIEPGKGGAGTVVVRAFAGLLGGVESGLKPEVDRIAAFLDRPLALEVAPSTA